MEQWTAENTKTLHNGAYEEKKNKSWGETYGKAPYEGDSDNSVGLSRANPSSLRRFENRRFDTGISSACTSSLIGQTSKPQQRALRLTTKWKQPFFNQGDMRGRRSELRHAHEIYYKPSDMVGRALSSVSA